MFEEAQAQGEYEVTCTRNGRVKWSLKAPNLVVVVGANLMLDCAFSNAPPGISYSGLITTTGFGAINVNDTMLAKNWIESACYTGNRPQVAWQSANSGKKVWSAPVQYRVATADTINGCFLVYGTGATHNVLSNTGTLYSASTFANGSQSVQPGDVITVQYATQLVRPVNPTIFPVLVNEGGFARENNILQTLMLVNERTLAVFSAVTITGYHTVYPEAGSALTAQLANPTYRISYLETLRSQDAQTPGTAYLVTVSEPASAVDTSDGAFFFVHESATAADFPSATQTYKVTTAEALFQTRGLQTSLVTLGGVVADPAFAQDTQSTPGSIFIVSAHEQSQFGATASTDGALGIYILDELGNFITDESGNRIIIDTASATARWPATNDPGTVPLGMSYVLRPDPATVANPPPGDPYFYTNSWEYDAGLLNRTTPILALPLAVGINSNYPGDVTLWYNSSDPISGQINLDTKNDWVISVGLNYPTDNSFQSPAAVTLTQAASGAMDANWNFAANVAAYGISYTSANPQPARRNIIVRPGWEMNGNWYCWGKGYPGQVGTWATDFAAAFARCAQIFKNVGQATGVNMIICLNLNGDFANVGGGNFLDINTILSPAVIAITDMYAIDIFDKPQYQGGLDVNNNPILTNQQRFDQFVLPNLQSIANTAKTYSKMTGVCEFGAGDSTAFSPDNPEFIASMAQWVRTSPAPVGIMAYWSGQSGSGYDGYLDTKPNQFAQFMATAPAGFRNEASMFVPAGYTQVFFDNFDAPKLDQTKWWTRMSFSGGTLDYLNDEWERYRETGNHVLTPRGTLRLTGLPYDNSVGFWPSGMIRSKVVIPFGQSHGFYVEGRMKVPSGLGVWPAFWTAADDRGPGLDTWPPEIDFLELVVNTTVPGQADGTWTPHLGTQDNGNSIFGVNWLYADPNFVGQWGYWYAGKDMSLDYHVWGFQFNPYVDAVTSNFFIYIDGLLILAGTYKWIYDDSTPATGNIILNLAIGGSWAGRNGVDNTAFPQALEVDYVRVYEQGNSNTLGVSTVGVDFVVT